MIDNLKLGPKFTLLLAIVFLGGMLLSGVTLWSTLQHEAENNVTTKAEILTQTMDSVRRYTSEHVRPLLEKQLLTEDKFIREIVPAFSARRVFEQFRDNPEYNSFFYKEATPNPTNPDDLADAFETDLFEQFRRQPGLTELSGYRQLADKQLYYTAHPLVMRQVSCLKCHGDPAAAPKSQIAAYGDKTGFGWHLNDVVAVQTVYVPADEVQDRGRRNTALMMGIFGAMFAIAILLINRLLKDTVIQPIRQLNAIALKVSSGSLNTAQLEEFNTPTITKVAQRKDEPGQLARTFQQMAQEVATREQNLSHAVEERTAQLAEKTKEAQQASQAKSQFLANMSHELRTPLNIILGFSQLMNRQGALDPKQQNYLTTINRSGEHLLDLINNVLELSKIEAGKTTLNNTNFDLRGLLDWLQTMFQFKAQSKGIQFILQATPNLPHQICADEGKLRQILVNLLGNAIKFTQHGQVILRISSVTSDLSLPSNRSSFAEQFSQTTDKKMQRANAQGQATLTFEVEDTGPGIASSELAELFQPFGQTETGRNSQEGTGLGLPIAQQFVELMGGTLTVQSQVGVGTTFRFMIPVQLVDIQSAPTLPSREIIGLAPGQPTYRILIADDKPENRQFLVELLISVGFEVREASNGNETIALCQSWTPHLVWIDLRMPVLNGYEATKMIKANLNPTPIMIALTGSAFEEDRITALAAGCDDFVRKPFRIEIIFEKIAVHLGVRYRYAAEPTDISSAAKNSMVNQSLVPADLNIMPLEWRLQLHQAATRVNAKLILQLIDRIPPDHAHLIRPLTDLVHNFQFEEIMALTQPDLS